ncbi:MAG: CHASE2 domain-containing protein [Candidatus Omnitrophota bacterium]|nr:MAG: CHASE2 domain-containing protein [Candidatus Omnitrophota bacterium]
MPIKSIYISKRPIGIIAALVISALIILISYFRIFDVYELATLDLRFKLRPAQRTSDRIAIIEIARDTLEQIGTWPIDREFYARLIDILTEFGARSIIFDVIFAQKQNELSDEELVNSVAASKRVYLALAFRLTKEVGDSAFPQAQELEASPFSSLDKAAYGIGHINVIPDIDGKLRRTPVFIDYKDRLYPQLSFLAACDYLGKSQDTVKIDKKFVQIDSGIKIRIDEDGQMLINFADRWGKAFKHYSFIDILKSYIQLKNNEKPRLALKTFKDKICLVGLTAVGTHDLNPVPLQADYPMVGVNTNIINSILTNNFIHRAGKLTNIIILIFLGLVASFLTLKLKPLKSLLMIVGLLFVFTLFSYVVFAFFKTWLDLFYPLLLVSLVYLFTTFYKYISERNKRMLIERELDIARRIQKSFLKETPPEKEGLDIAVIMDAAKAVGGDLYDFVDISADEIGIMVGDVSGKGVPAALFMAMTVSNFRFHARGRNQPADVMARLNNQISAESTSGLFVTVYYLIADVRKKILKLADAGHLPLIIAHPNAEVETLKVEGGMAVGIMEGTEYTERQTPFGSGDIFLLYTDGVTEARNVKKEEFGENRIKQALSECRNKSAKEIIEHIYKTLKKFTRKAPQHDDITIIVLKAK